ncbi:MAG: DUF4760 domain-containing protein [Thermoleophilaceae bacterium]
MDAAIDVRLVGEGTDWAGWITLGIIVVSAIVAFLALLDARRTRHGQLVIEALRDWSTPEAEESHALHGQLTEETLVALTDRLFKTPAPRIAGEDHAEDLKTWNQAVRVANLIEALGVLVSTRALTSKVVYKMWGGAILEAWPKWDKAVKLLRHHENQPDQFQYLEEISLEMQRISRKRKRKLATTSSDPRDPQAAEEWDLGRNAHSSLPPKANHSAPDTRLAWALTALVLLSACYGWVRRRVSA